MKNHLDESDAPEGGNVGSICLGGLAPDEISLLQTAIVDAAIAFRLSNLLYEHCCELSEGDELLCQVKLADAANNQAALFALVDNLLLRHPLNG